MKTRLFAVCIALVAFSSACKEPETPRGTIPLISIEGEVAVDYYSAIVSATIYGEGVTERGVCWGTEADPTIDGKGCFKKQEGAGDGKFDARLNGLTENTAYHARAYAKVGIVTFYSIDVPFATTKKPTFNQNSAFFTALDAAGLRYGVVRDGEGNFVMHYSINKATESVTITYIQSVENKDAVHQTELLALNGAEDELTWGDAEKGDKIFGGIAKVGDTFEVIGSDGLVLVPNMASSEIIRMYSNGNLNRVSELRQDDPHHSSINPIWNSANIAYVEFNAEYNCAVGMPGAGYLFRKTIISNISEDVFRFTFDGYETSQGFMTSDPTVQANQAADMQPFLNVWEAPAGVIIVPDNGTATPDQGGYLSWVISKAGTGWFQMWLRFPD